MKQWCPLYVFLYSYDNLFHDIAHQLLYAVRFRFIVVIFLYNSRKTPYGRAMGCSSLVQI